MDDTAIAKEIANCAKETERSAIIAAEDGDFNALARPSALSSIEEVVDAVKRSAKPTNLLIRSLEPNLVAERFQLQTASRAIVKSSVDGAGPTGFVPLLAASLTAEACEAAETKKATHEGKKKSNVLYQLKELYDKNGSLMKEMEIASGLVSQTRMPTFINPMVRGISGGDFFALASGSITFIIALQCLYGACFTPRR